MCFPKSLSRCLPWLLLIASTALAGCGSDRPETVRVTGRVTSGGGDWPASGMIIFTPDEPAAGLPRRPGKAFFDKQGRFTVGTFDDSDGLVPGTYHVSVFCGEPVEGMAAPDRSYVPLQYQLPGPSGLVLEVKADSRNLTVEYDIPRTE